MPETKKEACRDCRFWERWAGDTDTMLPIDNGWCHRFPPTNASGSWEFPTSNEDDWCGEFQRVESENFA